MINLKNYIKGNCFPVSILNVNRVVEKNQRTYFPISLMNYGKEVRSDQFAIVNLMNYGEKVGKEQGAGINLMNYGEKVGKEQGAGINLMNYGKEVGSDQFTIVNLMNYGEKVGKDQEAMIFNILNLANKIKGQQKNGLVNIVTNSTAKQKGLINYNPFTGLCFGTDIISKNKKIKEKFKNKYLLEKNDYNSKVIEDLAERGYSLFHKVTGIYTKKDLMKRQARKILKKGSK